MKYARWKRGARWATSLAFLVVAGCGRTPSGGTRARSEDDYNRQTSVNTPAQVSADALDGPTDLSQVASFEDLLRMWPAPGTFMTCRGLETLKPAVLEQAWVSLGDSQQIDTWKDTIAIFGIAGTATTDVARIVNFIEHGFVGDISGALDSRDPSRQAHVAFQRGLFAIGYLGSRAHADGDDATSSAAMAYLLECMDYNHWDDPNLSWRSGGAFEPDATPDTMQYVVALTGFCTMALGFFDSAAAERAFESRRLSLVSTGRWLTDENESDATASRAIRANVRNAGGIHAYISKRLPTCQRLGMQRYRNSRWQNLGATAGHP